MIEQGIKDGKINRGHNNHRADKWQYRNRTCICGSLKGASPILIMPDTMSVERRKIVTALGAEIKLTPGREGMKGAIDEAQRLKEHYGNAFIPQQFENRANPDIHRATTASGNLGGYRWKGRYLCIICRNRRHLYRHRAWIERP